MQRKQLRRETLAQADHCPPLGGGMQRGDGEMCVQSEMWSSGLREEGPEGGMKGMRFFSPVPLKG